MSLPINTNIQWDDAYLYHGSCLKIWEDAYDSKTKDVLIKMPTHEQHWLGRGLYFGVNNVITPVKFALRKAHKNNCDPVIVEVPGKKLRQSVRDKVLDLTHHVGILSSYIISKEFGTFAQHYNDEDTLKNIKNGLFNNKLYSNSIKTFFSLDKEWFTLMKQIEPILKKYNSNNEIIDELRKNSSMNISNLIYDWFNYYKSSGIEKDVPVKAILANFNTGTPLLYNDILDKMSLSERTFYDFTTILSRTEISFLGYKYYTLDEKWKFSDIFVENFMADSTTYEGESEIIAFIAQLIHNNVEWAPPKEKNCYDYAKTLYDDIAKERDQL